MGPTIELSSRCRDEYLLLCFMIKSSSVASCVRLGRSNDICMYIYNTVERERERMVDAWWMHVDDGWWIFVDGGWSWWMADGFLRKYLFQNK